ncbi:MAG: hypothetical protein SH821_13320 [Phototrophicales bacterium]|nr:hypothetical protein [Phototrophicales bacterium]
MRAVHNTTFTVTAMASTDVKRLWTDGKTDVATRRHDWMKQERNYV